MSQSSQATTAGAFGDAYCRLLGWQPESAEWSCFTVEGSAGQDTFRLADHLGLAFFDLRHEWNELNADLVYPGAVLFLFREYRKATSSMCTMSGGLSITGPRRTLALGSS